MNSETAQILESLGLSRNLSKMLAYLQSHSNVSQEEIMAGAGLTQPGVSLGGKEGEALGWIKIESLRHRSGPGAPLKSYSLAIPFCRIIEFLESQKAGEALVISRKVEHLKELVA